MRIHHLLSTPRGGAGIATRKILNAVSSSDDHQVFFGLHSSEQTSEWRYSPATRRSFDQRLLRLQLSIAKKFRPRSPEQLTLAQAGDKAALPPDFGECDLVHLHWLGEHWTSLEAALERVPAGTPVVWTLHDQNAVTAICHYTGDCRGYETGCPRCPWLNILGQGLVRESFAAKERVFTRHPIHLVCISEWQHDLISTSILGSRAASRQVIGLPFYRPVEVHTELDRQAARLVLGLDPHANYALLGATNLANPRKGLLLALEAARLRGPTTKWLTFGAVNSILPTEQDFGIIRDPAHLSLIYRAANMFVMPSIEEALGLTGLEAMSHGTPVLGFAGTGLTDYVISARTGLLAPEKSARALADSLEELEQTPSLGDPRQVERAFGEIWQRRYEPAAVAAKYRSLYQAAVTTSRRSV